MTDAVVLFSGGQDSCTVLEVAISMHGADKVTAVSVFYGQRHAIELECGVQYTAAAGVEHLVIDAGFFGSLAPSALTGKGNVNDAHSLIKEVPASFVPNRNAFMLTIAHSVAQAKGATFVYGGMCETDFSGYPDCRAGFVAQMQVALNSGSNADVSFITPLMYLNKAETFQLAKDLGALERIIEGSHTCYNGDHEHRHDWGYGCGECPACELRAKGYAEFLGEA